MPEPPAARGQASAYADFEEPSETAQSRRERAAAEARRKAEAEAEVKAQAEARRQAEADAKAEAKAQAEARRQAEADAKAEAKAQAEARRQAEADAKAEAKAEAEARKQAEAEAKRRARAQARAEEEEEEEGKGKSKMWVIAAIVAVLLGGSGVYYTLYLRKPVPKPAVAEQTVAHPAESRPLTPTGKPKPGPATPTTTTSTTATPTPDAGTQTAEDTDQPTAPSTGSDAMQQQLNTAPRIAGNIKPAADTGAPPPPSGNIDMGSSGGPQPVFNSKPALNVAIATPKTISVAASIMSGRATYRPLPDYPPIARAAGVAGTVVLHVTISKTGTVQNVSVVSGPQMLRQAALDKVKTWRYKPYLLDNEPVEVETNVDLPFLLSR
jgi:protein TonB